MKELLTSLKIFISISYFILGLYQLFAIMDGLEIWIGLHWIIAVPLSFILAYIPIVGTVVGMCGAVYAWNWTWLQSGGLFLADLL